MHGMAAPARLLIQMLWVEQTLLVALEANACQLEEPWASPFAGSGRYHKLNRVA